MPLAAPDALSIFALIVLLPASDLADKMQGIVNIPIVNIVVVAFSETCPVGRRRS